MTTQSSQYPYIEVTLNLRNLNVKVDNLQGLLKIWQALARDLIGKPITTGQRLELTGSKGKWSLIVLDTHGIASIDEKTYINVVDIERNPQIRHACKECKKQNKTMFGPFFCPECRRLEQPDRLCEIHTQFLENKYTAYCPEHLPRCQNSKGSDDPATFECDYCHKTFSDKWKHHHPNDQFTLLCRNCYSFLFELCEDCQHEGHKRLGKSRCAFPTGVGDEKHGKRICTLRHARQWQIWGPHWRGIILCEQHYQQLSQASSADLLWMLITAKPPTQFLRSKITDVYRLRNLIGYVRQKELSWEEMERVLRGLAERIEQYKAPKYVKEHIRQITKKVGEVQTNLPIIEAELLDRIRDFYRSRLRENPVTVVLGVTIKKVFWGRGNKTPSYKIAVHVGRDSRGKSMKGLLIGKKGTLVNQLENHLKLHAVERIDFEE